MKYVYTVLLSGICATLVLIAVKSGASPPDPVFNKDPSLAPEYVSKGEDKNPQQSRAMYLDLMKRSLTDLLYENDDATRIKRGDGEDWPGRAYTMIGLKRLDNLHFCIEDVLANDVPGDMIETGAWRGGATIFMRAVLKSHGANDRTVWVADSFEGLPAPDPAYPADAGSDLHEKTELAISLTIVKKNFTRYGLLDDNVQFLKGWFKDTLPIAPIEKIAVLRLDGDLYQSTDDALVNLYPKLSSGGYCIIDDWGAVQGCRQAVLDYRKKHGITAEIKIIDWGGVYWKKP